MGHLSCIFHHCSILVTCELALENPLSNLSRSSYNQANYHGQLYLQVKQYNIFLTSTSTTCPLSTKFWSLQEVRLKKKPLFF